MSEKNSHPGRAFPAGGLTRRELLLGVAGLTVLPRLALGAAASVASEHDAGPYMYNLRGRRHGYDVEKVELVLEALRIQVVHFAMDRTSIFKALDEGKVDFAFSFTTTPERLAKYHVVAPLHVGRVTFAVRKEELKEPFGLASLVNKRVGVTTGHRYPKEFDDAPGITRVPCGSMTLGMRRLADRQVDAVIGDRNALLWQVERRGLGQAIAVSSTDLWSGSYSCIFPKRRGDLATLFDAKLRQLQTDGKFAELDRSYPTVDGHLP